MLEDCFLLPNLVTRRESLPEGFGALPLTRLRLAPYAFGSQLDRRGFASDPLGQMAGLTQLRDLSLEHCQVNPWVLSQPMSLPCAPVHAEIGALLWACVW